MRWNSSADLDGPAGPSLLSRAVPRGDFSRPGLKELICAFCCSEHSPPEPRQKEMRVRLNSGWISWFCR